MNIDEKLRMAAKTGNMDFVKYALQDISDLIGSAINPVPSLRAPFMSFALRRYAEAIESSTPGAEEARKSLEMLFASIKITIPVNKE